MYGTVADQVYQDLTNHSTGAPAAVEDVEPQTVPDPTTVFEAARAKFFQEGQKVCLQVNDSVLFLYLMLLIGLYPFFIFVIQVLAEQQAGRKAAPSDNERDRSPIRGNRAPLLPDPVPGSFAQIRPKRRALLPTPPGAPEDAAVATTTPEGSDPVVRYT